MDENKRLSVTLMFALGTFCSKFGSRNPKEETVTFLMKVGFFSRHQKGKPF
ncbi:ATP-binding protein [Enterococcus mundtii]|nr:ATP-binding protein [Enterococcus mundtii]